MIHPAEALDVYVDNSSDTKEAYTSFLPNLHTS